jgi:hypothetical protein
MDVVCEKKSAREAMKRAGRRMASSTFSYHRHSAPTWLVASALLLSATSVAAFSCGGFVASPRAAWEHKRACVPLLRARTRQPAVARSGQLPTRMSLANEDPSRLYATVADMEPSFLKPISSLSAVEATENSTVLPLFPLGAVVYTPYSEHRLNIFEPRYRAMYNDILFSGSRRFAGSSAMHCLCLAP